MKKSLVLFVTALSFVFASSVVRAQQAEAPIYKDGDWWRVKVEVIRHQGSRSGACHEMHNEYTVKMVEGKAKVYGGTGPDEIDCSSIATQLLGLREEGDTGIEYLKFPLKVGKSWTSLSPQHLARRTRWVSLEYKVLAWEKIPTPKEILEAFKIEVSGWPGGQTRTYYYSPKARAIVLFEMKAPASDRMVTLVDFNVSP